ncbi:NAD(P)/FAD-dependent oxidoreductase [Cohnella sp. GbtcB17]|uniref:NAD(P)/FAD-dependent oxidoreductase n=1 Tax=Cohnella sp. GbtcB17 TaxID=2824762 RepID=UPI001C30DD99|nr:FAD-dependent oxidoreductase [Cohnella sp. GbtcB17]
MSRNMVIIGAGQAGARAALELREQGWKGGISLIGREAHPPYERPPLSKDAMVGEAAASPAAIISKASAAELGIELATNTSAMRIDPSGHRVLLQDGRELGYERLLLATGASSRRLLIGGKEPAGLLYLRTYPDALLIRDRLSAGSRIVIVGAGFTGLELAASARQRGCEVVVLEAGPRILMRGVSAEIAADVYALHRAQGVAFELGVGIKAIEPIEPAAMGIGRRHLVKLADGRTIECDAVIAGIGAVPDTSLAESAGLEIENGIRASHTLATSDADIFAAGDCCSFPHPLYGGRRIRLESWRNAEDQGAHAAAAMLGGKEPYAAVPWFWSDQYDRTLQVSGLSDAGATTVARIAEDGVNRLFFGLDEGGRLVSASGIGAANIAKDIKAAELMIQRRLVPDPALLARPGIKLKSLLLPASEEKGA